jgi:hypothetical protein
MGTSLIDRFMDDQNPVEYPSISGWRASKSFLRSPVPATEDSQPIVVNIPPGGLLRFMQQLPVPSHHP